MKYLLLRTWIIKIWRTA